jgi:hypothetical protein
MTFSVDVSYYQKAADDSYRRGWFIFRACDGTFRDPNFAANLAWAKRAVKTTLTGYTVYVVYRPGVDVLSIVKSMLGTPDNHLTVMIDVESWGGEIRGDHSSEITRLAEALAQWLGDKRRVLAYGNQGDLANLYPHRPSWLKLVVASYGMFRPNLHNMFGWQYSDGSLRWSVLRGYPRSSKPFGNCDHNFFLGLSAKEIAATLGVSPSNHTTSGSGSTPLSEYEDSTMADGLSPKALAQIRALLDEGVEGPRGQRRPFWYFAAYPRAVRRNARAAAKAAKKGHK